MSRLRAVELNKRYKKRVVVHDVSIEVSSGEVVGLLGPNGAGQDDLLLHDRGAGRRRRRPDLHRRREITRLPIHRRARLGCPICRRKRRCSGG